MTLKLVCAGESWPYFVCDQKQTYVVGRDSSFGIVTRYGLEGPGIEIRWGEIFCARPDRPWGGPTQPPIQRVSFPEVQPMRGHQATRLKKE